MEQTVENFKVNDKTKIGFQNIVGEFCGGDGGGGDILRFPTKLCLLWQKVNYKQ